MSVIDVTIGALGEFDCTFPTISNLKCATTGEAIANALKQALYVIWPTDEAILEHQHQIRLLMSDGASYLVTAVTLLHLFGLHSLQHNTCLVHGVDLVIKKALAPHKIVTTFMSNVLSTLHFSNVRAQQFQTCSNSHYEIELITMLYQKEIDPDLTNLNNLLSNNTDGDWERLLLGKFFCNSLCHKLIIFI